MVTGQPKRNRDDLNQRASKGAYQRVHADNRQWQAGTYRPRHQNYGQYSPSDPDVADLDLDSQIQQLQASSFIYTFHRRTSSSQYMFFEA